MNDACARRLIDLVRYGKPGREDLLLLCSELEARLESKSRPAPRKPHPALRRANPRRWFREYMRWRRWHGQAGDGREAA
jgi:hypothetical protein